MKPQGAEAQKGREVIVRAFFMIAALGISLIIISIIIGNYFVYDLISHLIPNMGKLMDSRLGCGNC
jgi:hypothetical protein